jgi:hypothetical protein
MSEIYLHEARTGLDVADVEEELTRGFLAVRDAIVDDRPVVVCLDEQAVQAVAPLPDVAVAHGLIGMVRALATEGRKPGWTVVALSVPEQFDREERDSWAQRLAFPAATGSLLRLGGEHLGRVVV